MYLFRALNHFDQLVDPIENGIVSKQLIYDTARNYLFANNKDFILNLSKKDQERYIKEYMNNYLLEHNHKLSKIFEKKSVSVKNNIYSFTKNKDNISYFQMLKDISSLPNHLINGSKTYTNWISTTSCFDKIWPYYDKQDIHAVAVINIYSNGVFNEDTYVVDVSNKEVINKIQFLSNKISDLEYNNFLEIINENPELSKISLNLFHQFMMKPTSKKFMGLCFSAASNEYSIYQYLKKELIVSVLDSLSIDLICADLFNDKFLLLSKKEQIKELDKLKQMILKHVKKENDGYLLYVFDELYLKNHNILKIASTDNEKKKMILKRNEIITKAQKLPSILIKKK